MSNRPRAWTLVFALNHHGKEGVVGSSPTEGLQSPCIAGFLVSGALARHEKCPQSVPRSLWTWGREWAMEGPHGARLQGRPGARAGVVRQVPSARRAPDPEEDRSSMDRAGHPPAGYFTKRTAPQPIPARSAADAPHSHLLFDRSGTLVAVRSASAFRANPAAWSDHRFANGCWPEAMRWADWLPLCVGPVGPRLRIAPGRR